MTFAPPPPVPAAPAAPAAPKSKWADVGAAAAFDKTQYLDVPGLYVCELTKAALKKADTPTPVAVWEFKVLKGPAYVGESVAYARKKDADKKKQGYFNKDVKTFCCVIAGIPLESVNNNAPETIDYLDKNVFTPIMDENKAVGAIIVIRVSRVTGKNDPTKTYTDVVPLRKATAEDLQGVQLPF
jgi:hypothetical protein